MRRPCGLRGSGKKKSKGLMSPNPCGRSFTISVVVIETTAGLTRAATSANEGMVIDVTGPCAVVIGVEVCALDFCIRPRSALMRTPNPTDAMMIATIDRMRLLD